MAEYALQVALHNFSGLPRDDAVNTLYYQVDAPDTLGGTMDDIAAAYVAKAGFINEVYQGMTIKAYAHPAGGAPLDTRSYSAAFAAGEGPTEVALALSYSADDGVAGAPRRRGRIFLPFFNSGRRPSATMINALLSFGQDLASIGFAGNTTWKLYSRANAGLLTIESISVDNEWDTQRRRGMKATSRTRQDVQ